ncbi:hypothetical protein NDK43_23860 [Neobacillus pocheonensis]|uniref:Uncharacterized protein n=1 Tax=Neobacillus pocheonensis TaxID=363869 RepID=A0ABT0WH39_9BACI|nr:hypothetical protein [Neobacillus pocheonensis]
MKKGFPIVISCFLLAACSQSTVSHTTPSNVSNSNQQVPNNPSNNQVEGYIYQVSKEVLFLQFTNTNGNLDGSFYERWEDSNNQFKTADIPLTGQIAGNTISITMKASGKTYTGKFSNEEIDLAVPRTDGTVSNIEFKPGTLNDFNTAVSQIQASVSNDQQAAQQAQQNANLNNQLSSLEDQVNKEMQSIQNGEQYLQNDVQKTGNFISTEEKDLARVAQAEQKVMNEPPGPQAGSDAGSVGSDAGSVGSDDDSIQSDDAQFQSDVQTLQNNLTSFDNDFASMNSTASQLGETLPENLPKQSDVYQIGNKVQSVITSTQNAMNGYIAKSKQMVNSANSFADKVQKHVGN